MRTCCWALATVLASVALAQAQAGCGKLASLKGTAFRPYITAVVNLAAAEGSETGQRIAFSKAAQPMLQPGRTDWVVRVLARWERIS
jgi:hypothetical protein